MNNAHVQIPKNNRKQSQDLNPLSNEQPTEKSDNNFIYDVQFQQYKTKSKNRKNNNTTDFQPIHCCVNNTYGIKLELPADQIQRDYALMQKIISGIPLTEQDLQITRQPTANGGGISHHTNYNSKRNMKKNHNPTRSENLSIGGEESNDFKRLNDRLPLQTNDDSQTNHQSVNNYSYFNG